MQLVKSRYMVNTRTYIVSYLPIVKLFSDTELTIWGKLCLKNLSLSWNIIIIQYKLSLNIIYNKTKVKMHSFQKVSARYQSIFNYKQLQENISVPSNLYSLSPTPSPTLSLLLPLCVHNSWSAKCSTSTTQFTSWQRALGQHADIGLSISTNINIDRCRQREPQPKQKQTEPIKR